MSKIPVHPGKVLSEELDALGILPAELARQIDVPPNRICQIINGKRSISGDTALRLAHWFRTSPELWLGLQAAYALEAAREVAGRAIQRLPRSTEALRTNRRHANVSRSLLRTG